MLARRQLLTGMVALATINRAPGAVGLALDLDDPAQNLRAFVKLLGSLDAAPVFDLIRGSVYALVPGEAARPLFRTAGAGRASYTRLSGLEYSAESRYVGLLLDGESGEPLRRWTNPYTGSVRDVPVTRYGPGETRILTDRIVTPAAAPASPPRGVRPWFRLGDVVHMQRNVILPAPTRPDFPKADLITYSGDWRALADPARDRIRSRLNFTAVEAWRPWMGMDGPDAPAGALWWHVSGVKLDGPADFPSPLRDWLRAVDPDFF